MEYPTLVEKTSESIRTKHLIKILLRRFLIKTRLSRLPFTKSAVRSYAKRFLSSRAVLFSTFVILCSAHAVRRGRIDLIERSEHAGSSFKFLRLAVKRYREGLGANIVFWRQTYLTPGKWFSCLAS